MGHIIGGEGCSQEALPSKTLATPVTIGEETMLLTFCSQQVDIFACDVNKLGLIKSQIQGSRIDRFKVRLNKRILALATAQLLRHLIVNFLAASRVVALHIIS